MKENVYDYIAVTVSMPSRAYTSFLRLSRTLRQLKLTTSVNALSGLYLISTLMYQIHIGQKKQRVNALSGLYLISTKTRFMLELYWKCVNALSGLYLISTLQIGVTVRNAE